MILKKGWQTGYGFQKGVLKFEEQKNRAKVQLQRQYFRKDALYVSLRRSKMLKNR